ncbi:hypothetical protein [Streptomyces sp. NPDC002276]
MNTTARTAQPGPAAAIELFDLVVSGALRAVTANADGSWTITPVVGRPLLLTGPAEVYAYVDQAHGTGPAALTPVRAALPAMPAETAEPEPAGCGCVPAAPALPSGAAVDLMQARAISAALGDLGITPARRSAAYDETAQAAAVRVASTHGVYALHVPPVGRPFSVWRNGARDGSLGARRVPANTDSYLATLYAAYLRERGEL